MSTRLIINGHEFEAEPGHSIFEYAEGVGIRVPTTCQKQGKCKECMVEVMEGMECLSPRSEPESHLKDRFRLSCCTRVVKEGAVHCHTLRRGAMKIERHALEWPQGIDKPALEPSVTRDGDRILLDGREIARSTGPIYGIAMDLGTTTVVLRVVDLETGELVADASFENPQRFGGSDVMARIFYDTEHRGKLLQRTLAGYLTQVVDDLPIDKNSIYEMVVVGNSTMRDLFFRLDVHSIGQKPYRSITELEMEQGLRKTTSMVGNAKKLWLPLHPKARVYSPPIISGHVGADAAACMLAVDLTHETRKVALMDIGTNTELILLNGEQLLAASCPAGPAFEGGAIACGMPGLKGAIERVHIEEDGSFTARIIDSDTPEGICGSGLVELMSELMRTGVMNKRGRFANEQHSITIDAEHGIHFTEPDVVELAQAKGANVAGLYALHDLANMSLNDVDVFYLAGGFGRHLNIEASKRIGLIPNIADEKIVHLGNGAIEGATLALVSRTKREELEKMVARVTHCSLESHPMFFEYFVAGCQFQPVDDFKLGVTL